MLGNSKTDNCGRTPGCIRNSGSSVLLEIQENVPGKIHVEATVTLSESDYRLGSGILYQSDCNGSGADRSE